MSERIKLEGAAAKAKWKEGREAWNKWVDENPDADVSFEGVVFDQEDVSERIINDEIKIVFNFDWYRFPNGWVNFNKAEFGEGNVSFSHVKFGDGDVTFGNAQFGKGDVNFSGVQFGSGDVSFCGVGFGEGDVNFSVAKFGEGNVTFSGAKFGEGDVYFSGAKFGEGIVNFNNANFGAGNVYFERVKFGEGALSFELARVKDGDLKFNNASIRSQRVDLSLIRVNGATEFSNLFVGSNCEEFSFDRATFEGPFTLSFRELVESETSDNKSKYTTVNFIPDLVGTKTSHHVNLHNLYCKPGHQRNFFRKTAVNICDAERLGRLKEIAEGNKDHESALRFHADEMRVKRWVKTPLLASILDLMFDKTSNYGRSILRPFVGLVAINTFIFFISLYASTYPSSLQILGDAINLSLSKTLPFVSGLVFEGREAARELGLTNGWKALINGISVFAYVFLFLIGLGLRNRFRI
ncbi:hypothetical protein VIBNISO65_830027 [Vibrio nigripulchritudo SO65]|uniref:hypothetical protein n=1 Tax=Vibrio nigripulchritudo TaxID=28173 RepID=UPI0003B1BD17|nr:hypothetical protein [Vibrio nigripulchritudo]CCN38215.1 hypothetical protein VIBNIAM115_840027 [Vibrio nigripulchritudo AM115]CCN42693.1 hypothetical protein VIBNIFTn2_360027 [Vibrio nigripulchritudo FTn2]CCN79089.1 hypothetical protein VIBNISO65_830027 [Vibrio nigripulchritudo SO65]